jgi:rhodanese-related sulfurtransferase
MNLLLICFCAAISCVLIAIWLKRRNDNRDLESHSITPEALHTLMNTDQGVLVFDIRRPLDLLTDLEVIPGSTRVSLKEFFQNPSLIPIDKDSVVYCTCPGDQTARRVVQQALRLRFTRMKLLRGGLPAWKAKGYAVTTYDEPFQLDIRT